MGKLLILCLLGLSTLICGKGGDDSKTSSGDKSTDGKTEDKKQPHASIDSVFFAEWNGKKIMIEDNYRYSENEKKMTQETGSDYGAYGEKIKELVKKYGKYNEQSYDFYLPEYQPEFAEYTSLHPKRKMFLSTTTGTYPVDINGYYVNMDDMIGGGVVMYATGDMPQGVTVEERELMLCSYNGSMGKLMKQSADRQLIDKFAAFVMPKLKGLKQNIYNEKTQQEETKEISKLADEDIKVFKGSFTGADKDEYLVGVKFNNEATSFTSGAWIMDASGNVVKEVSALTPNNFTYSWPYMIVDFNGDGMFEIISDDGYYEGGGYNFLKYDGSAYKVMTTGFVFGV